MNSPIVNATATRNQNISRTTPLSPTHCKPLYQDKIERRASCQNLWSQSTFRHQSPNGVLGYLANHAGKDAASREDAVIDGR
jgi:hypothetical protein